MNMYKIAEKMKKSLLLTAICIASVACTSTAIAQSGQQGIAAVVNDDIITTYDLTQRVKYMIVTTGAERTEASVARIQRQALDNLINERLQVQELDKYESTVGDEEVNEGVARLFARNQLDPNEMVQRLASIGVSIETVRDQVRSEIAWQRVINGVYGQRIRITDSQIEEMMDRMEASASKPQYRVSEIFIEATPEINGKQGALVGANAMIAQLKEGAPFQLLARQFSSAASAANGGNVGYVHEGELRPELDEVVRQMEPGGVSNPIEVPGGFYVIVLRDKKISESETLYNLRQVTVESEDTEAAMVELKGLGSKLNSCDDVSEMIDTMEDVSSSAMGEVKESDLSPEIMEKLKDKDVGGLSDPFERPDGATSIMICDKEVTGSGVPTRQEIEDGLTDEQLAQASKRLLRDIRRKATLVVR